MSRKKNILFVVHRVPYPPDRGDRIRSFHLLKFLSARANVWLATLADEEFPSQSLDELKLHCKDVCVESLNSFRYLRGVSSLVVGKSATEGLFYLPQLRRQISHWCSEVQFDAAIGFCSSIAPYLSLSELKHVPKIIDLVDVDSEKFFEYSATVSGIKGFLYGLEAKRVRSLESRLGVLCEGVTFVTAPEAEIYRSFMPSANIRYATNGIDLDYYSSVDRSLSSTSEPSAAPICLFVGALDYPPNIDGVKWFCDHVWSTIQKRFPNAKFLVVGRNPTPEVLALNNLQGVQVEADVPDVRPYYKQSTVAIAPLRIARGLQNKVLEAFAMKIPVLSTPYAVEGIDISHQHAMVALSAEEWIESLLELFQNQERCRSLASAGYQFVEKHHSWEQCLQPFAELLSI